MVNRPDRRHRRTPTWARVAVAASLFAPLAACKKEKEKVIDEGTPQTQNPNPRRGNPNLDLRPQPNPDNIPIAKLTSEQILDLMSRSAEVYANTPKESESAFAATASQGADAFDVCFSEALKQARVHATASEVKLGFTADATNCLNAVAGTPSLVFGNAGLQFLAQETCRDGSADYSKFDGMTFMEYVNGDRTPCSAPSEIIAYAVTSTVGAITADNTGKKQKVIFDLGRLRYRGDASNGPCLHTLKENTLANENTCVNLHRNQVTNVTIDGVAQADKSELQFKRFDEIGLVADLAGGKPWFETGSIAFTANNWRGTLTYTDGDTPPTYTLENDAGEKLTGTLRIPGGNAFDEGAPTAAFAPREGLSAMKDRFLGHAGPGIAAFEAQWRRRFE